MGVIGHFSDLSYWHATPKLRHILGCFAFSDFFLPKNPIVDYSISLGVSKPLIRHTYWLVFLLVDKPYLFSSVSVSC